MATTTRRARDERVDLRLPGDVKRLIDEAASLVGLTVSAFILSLAVPRAREIIDGARALELSQRDSRRFLDALDDAEAKPNAALMRAAERYKRSGT